MKVFISGATSGIGLALAEHYLKHGHQVWGAGRNAEVLSALSEKYAGFKGLNFDASQAEASRAALESIKVNLDLAICSAGNCEYIEKDQFNAQAFRHMLDANIMTTVHCIEGLIPHLRKGSKLAVISSSVTSLPFVRAEAYGCAKSGLDYITKALMLSLSHRDIDVVLIRPGFVKTPLTDKNTFSMPFLMSPEQAVQRIVQGLDKGRQFITFPKRLTYSLSLLALLPVSWMRNILNRV